MEMVGLLCHPTVADCGELFPAAGTRLPARTAASQKHDERTSVLLRGDMGRDLGERPLQYKNGCMEFCHSDSEF